MKKILPLALFLSSLVSLGQCPNDQIYLMNQADIDNFAINYPNCTDLTHILWILGQGSDITNLNGLAPITSAFDIEIQNTQITDLSGLNNLQDLSQLGIWFNHGISNLDGLTSLESVNYLDIFVNAGLTELSGLDSIEAIENLNLFTNPVLTDISALSFLEIINSLTLNFNALSSLTGLENIHTVYEDLIIANENIEHINELSGLQSIGRLINLNNNAQLNDISALSNITELEELLIVRCSNITDYSGLENIQNISRRMRLGFNAGLTDLSMFSNLNSVGDLDIYGNDNLVSLSGLENLQAVTNRIFLDNNMSLTSIEAISDLSTTQIDQVILINNANLASCNNLFICTVLSDPVVQKTFFNNSAGCSSRSEVEASCFLSVTDLELDAAIVVFPNPVSEIVQIDISNGMVLEKIAIFSITGQELMNTTDSFVNVSSLTQGVYFVEVTTDQGSITKKVIKG